MSTEKTKLSLVVPCYNESEALPPFMEEVQRVMALMPETDFEIVLVNDGSKDDTLAKMRELAAKHDIVHYVSFSRNFGKEAAILAGLRHAEGDFVAVMDADLQDPPALLPEMLKAVTEDGYDCAGTRRTTRKGEPPIRSFFARCFYRLINAISEVQLEDGARDYRLFSRPMVDALLSLTEYNRFSKGLFAWVGFRTKWFEFENVERVAGETKWSFWKLFKYSLEGITSFTTAPLVISAFVGVLLMFVSVAAIVMLGIRQYVYHNSVDGWTSMVTIILLLSGLQLCFFGIFGQYFAKMYMETKNRPHYIVAERDKKAK